MPLSAVVAVKFDAGSGPTGGGVESIVTVPVAGNRLPAASYTRMVITPSSGTTPLILPSQVVVYVPWLPTSVSGRAPVVLPAVSVIFALHPFCNGSASTVIVVKFVPPGANGSGDALIANTAAFTVIVRVGWYRTAPPVAYTSMR